MIPRGVSWLPGAGSWVTRQGMIPRGDFLRKIRIKLGEIITKTEIIFTHYSVAQAASNYEENRLKISLDSPFN